MPRFEHDCPNCTYLGEVDEADAYACPQCGIPTIVLRTGNDGPEYLSGEHLFGRLPEDLQHKAEEVWAANG